MTKHSSDSGLKSVDSSTLVWDLVVRIFHWTIVIGFAINMLFAEEGKWLHRWVGYTIFGAILIRIIWGFIGSPHARFRDFIPTPKDLYAYLKKLIKGDDNRYIGHNPAGALMMIILVIMMMGCSVTGWMQGLDRFWGEEWLQETHELIANAIFVFAGLHVLGALTESFRHKENLIKSMITGRKRSAEGTDIDHENPSSRR